MKIFGERLKDLRMEKNISQADLAKAIGVTSGIICLCEPDRSEPTAPNVRKVADHFDVSAEYLLGRIDSY